jgi:hypothetical protein
MVFDIFAKFPVTCRWKSILFLSLYFYGGFFNKPVRCLMKYIRDNELLCLSDFGC